VMLAVGAILFSSTQFMPQILQENFGYTASWAGLSLMPGGFTALVMMVIAGQVSRYIQPRYLMAGALAFIGLAMYHFTNLTPDANFGWFAEARMFQMAALPVLFLTITSFSYVGLPPGASGQAAALINVARNLGGSIGVSAAQTLLAQREQFHQSRLAERLFDSSSVYRQTLKQVSTFFTQQGTNAGDAQHQAVGWLGQTLTNQAAYLSYIDVFAALAVFACLLIPVAFLLQKIDLRSAAAGH
jgi:DHA2 family multidrug resistance protein